MRNSAFTLFKQVYIDGICSDTRIEGQWYELKWVVIGYWSCRKNRYCISKSTACLRTTKPQYVALL